MDTAESTYKETKYGLDLPFDYFRPSFYISEAGTIDKDIVLALDRSGDICRGGRFLGRGKVSLEGAGEDKRSIRCLTITQLMS
jgi:hypothetical protein